jgi:hypothetical protein
MRDLDFCVILVTTLLSTYYHRDENNREYLHRYNDEFPDGDRLSAEIQKAFDFVEQCGLTDKSRAWKKTDLFTLLVEIYSAVVVQGLPLQPAIVGQRLEAFYSRVGELYATKGGSAETDDQKPGAEVFRYLKAATKATNDKYARVDRGEIISKLLASTLTRTSPKPPRKPKKPRNQSDPLI